MYKLNYSKIRCTRLDQYEFTTIPPPPPPPPPQKKKKKKSFLRDFCDIINAFYCVSHKNFIKISEKDPSKDSFYLKRKIIQ